MKKMLAALAAAAVLAAGCGEGSDEPKPTTETTAMKTIPSPSPNEAQALTAELERIVPGLAADREKAIDAARNTCDSIRNDAQNLEQATITRFTVGLDVDEVTTEQAGQIVALIESQGWCTPA